MDLVILLPVFRPKFDWLRQQLTSIAKQTIEDFNCIVSYDGLVSEEEQRIIENLLPDGRFFFLHGHQFEGTYSHVERLVREYGLRSKFFALCDQDDVWDPNKLQIQLNYFRDPAVSAVSANGWIVDQELEPIGGRTTFGWFRIQPKMTSYRFILNQITGASAIFRTNCMTKCIPFPDNLGTAVHDHWLYVAATSNGQVQFEFRTLWLYRQHDDNQIGASASKHNYLRILSAVRKVLVIIKIRISEGDDVIIKQGRVFHSEALRRWPESASGTDILDLPLTFKKRLTLLSPNELIVSNLESLRLALTRNQID